MPDASTLVAIGREAKRYIHYECGTWFRIRPANSYREYSVIAEERRSTDLDINFMSFATNQHTLV